MKQYYPKLSHSVSDVEDNIDMPTIHEILEIAGGIKITDDTDKTVKQQASQNESKNSWEEIDLVKLESEVFTLGIWKNYDDLESHISMPELMAIISGRRELDYEEKKFLAAVQGIDIEKNEERGQKEWEDLKARVFSGGKATDGNDILALQGQNAVKAGFGIGMGLDYEDLR
jgi:arylamine N-acetyltransferase